MADISNQEKDLDQDAHPRRSALIGHNDCLDRIAADGTQRRHHGYILSGPKGIGKATAAWRITEKLFASPQETGLFGDAPQMVNDEDPEVRLIRAGSHPDVLVVEADSSKASGGISVDQVRAVIPFLAHTPSRGSWRVVIIDALDDMNINGANALLKTLEEPPEKAIIMLINHQSKPVLPTIRSRAQMIALSPLGFEDTQTVIGKNYPDADQDWVDIAATLADGAPGKASLFAASGAIDLYAETTQMLAGEQTDKLTIDGLSSQWGAGGVKNLPRRQMGVMLIMRLLTAAARHGVVRPQPAGIPRLDIEDRAITQICSHHGPGVLAEWHQDYQSRFIEAERLNLDAAPIYYDLLSRLMTRPNRI